jgi:hypothetical protein
MAGPVLAEPVMMRLADRLSLIAPDLRGFGVNHLSR